jgi:hypothetical protein
MIQPRCLPYSIIARKVSVPEFLHSLDPQRKLVTLCVKLVKIGAKVVRHGRYVTFQLAFQTRVKLQNQAIGWLRKGCNSLGGGTVVRFP